MAEVSATPLQAATADIQDLAVTTAKIGTAAITTAKIADANITTAKIADANITTAKIADAQITTAKIGTLAVTSATIDNLAVGTIKIAGDAVTSGKRQDINIISKSVTVGAGLYGTTTFTHNLGRKPSGTPYSVDAGLAVWPVIDTDVNNSTIGLYNITGSSITVNVELHYW